MLTDPPRLAILLADQSVKNQIVNNIIDNKIKLKLKLVLKGTLEPVLRYSTQGKKRKIYNASAS